MTVAVTEMARWFSGDSIPLPGEALACVPDGPVAHVVLNRPAKRNAMTAQMWQGIIAMMGRLAAEPAVKLVVFRGAGGEAFSAGADISEFREVFADERRTRTYNANVRAAQLAVETLEKPTLALIRGACVGGGCGLALACDIRFATTDARFGIPPSKLGTAYSPPDTRRLVALVGPSRAKDMLFSGRLLDAAEAKAIGMVDRVVSDSMFEGAAADYAKLLLANSQGSIRTAKLMVNALSGIDPRPAELLEARFEASFSGADFREGFSAFCEKRPPRFA